jgi:hypothetical protein
LYQSLGKKAKAIAFELQMK